MMSKLRSFFPEYVNTNVWKVVGEIIYHTQPLINKEFTGNHITERIILGDLASAMNLEKLKENGITHIVSVINGGYEVFPNDFEYKIIAINDDPWVDIEKYFDEANEFIHNAIDPKNPLKINNKVYIHCHYGISRSVTILTAYLLWNMLLNNEISSNDDIKKVVENTIKSIQEKRPKANPNNGFVVALEKYLANKLYKRI